MNLIETRNPTTGVLIKEYPTLTNEEANTIINALDQAFLKWKRFNFSERSKLLLNLAALLRQRKKEYALLIANEMGKPISQGESEIEKCAMTCEFYAEKAPIFLQPSFIPTEYLKSYIIYQPLGTIFGIMPWNFPFWQVFRFAAANLMAGNTIALRHAPITTGCGLAIEALMLDAGLPNNVFRTFVITNDTTEFIIKHPSVRGVTLTGSPHAGQAVAKHAGSALKKVVLELGGNDPYLILKDADLEKAAKISVYSRLVNAGQVCIAAKRLIVDQLVYKDFEHWVLSEIKNFQPGNPLDIETSLGPLARADIRDKVHQQVQITIQQGANCLAGGEIISGPGYFYPPTVLGNVQTTMLPMQEEIFGPVVVLISAQNEAHAISLANSSPYGLGAAIFTEDLARGERIAAQEILAGTCNVNQLVASNPNLPFGGIKESGFGRELGVAGIHEFVNIKTICVR